MKISRGREAAGEEGPEERTGLGLMKSTKTTHKSSMEPKIVMYNNSKCQIINTHTHLHALTHTHALEHSHTHTDTVIYIEEFAHRKSCVTFLSLFT